MPYNSDTLIRYAGDFTPGVVVGASGVWLEMDDGERVLDFTAGQVCATVGHSHPRVVQAIEESLRTVVHLNCWQLSPPVFDLTETLLETLPPELSRAMYLSTGGEGNEAALKMAKLFTGKYEVASLTRSWHGMTAGASASGMLTGRKGYGPTLPGVHAIPAPYAYRCPIRHCDGECDCSCLEVGFDMLDQTGVGQGAAVIAEPVLSAGGVIVPPPDYFKIMREKCDERGMLLIFDECQTGLGRLGTMYGFEVYDVVPDILVLSKTLGGGLPISATITTAEIEERCYELGFIHATSHVSDPLPAAAANAVVTVVKEEGLAENARARGDQFIAGMREMSERHESIGDIRGSGLLVGVELVEDRETKAPANELGRALNDECMKCGLSIRMSGNLGANCLRFTPALSMTEEEMGLGIEMLDHALTNATASVAAAS